MKEQGQELNGVEHEIMNEFKNLESVFYTNGRMKRR